MKAKKWIAFAITVFLGLLTVNINPVFANEKALCTRGEGNFRIPKGKCGCLYYVISGLDT